MSSEWDLHFLCFKCNIAVRGRMSSWFWCRYGKGRGESFRQARTIGSIRRREGETNINGNFYTFFVEIRTQILARSLNHLTKALTTLSYIYINCSWVNITGENGIYLYLLVYILWKWGVRGGARRCAEVGRPAALQLFLNHFSPSTSGQEQGPWLKTRGLHVSFS